MHFIAMSLFLRVKFYAYGHVKDTVNDKTGRFFRHGV